MPIEVQVLIGVAVVTVVAIVLIFRRRAARASGGGAGKPDGTGKPDGVGREERIEDSAQLVRGVLLRLVDAIHRADTAADTSAATLNATRVEVSNISHVHGVRDAQGALIEEIDRVIAANASLRGELASTQQTLREQREQIESLRTAVRIDPLTRIHNRAAFDERLAEAWNRWERYQEMFCLVMIDADRFKAINDEHGHPAGDRVLRGLAQALKETIRGSDFVGRYGGEEFAVILPRCDLAEGRETAEKLRRAVSETHFSLDRSRIRITISLGVAVSRGAASARELLEASDRALYRAKEEGRDRVCTAGE